MRPNDDEIREEQEFHLAARSEYNQRELGQTEQEACEQAKRSFGNRTQWFEQTRGVNRRAWIDELRQDLQYALRGIHHSPIVAATVMIVLALGIGSATAVFSVVDRILFRALPYPNDQELVSFGLVAPIEPTEFMLGPDYAEWRRRQTVFVETASFSGTSDCDRTTPGEPPLRLRCAIVEASLLPMLGVGKMAAGRNFTAEEDRPGAPRAAILSHELWQSAYGGDPSILNRTLSLDGTAARVVGVLPAGFELPALNRFDLLVPQQLRGAVDPRGAMEVVRAFARLKPGINAQQAEQALAPLFQEALKSVPAAFRNEVRLRVQPLRDRQSGPDTRAASWLLLGAVIAVLAIVCANVANLLLARYASRRREFAVRAALGASQSRLLRQSLTETLVLSSAGALLGIAVAAAMLRFFLASAPEGIPRLSQATTLDGRVLLFGLVLAMSTGCIAGLMPALQAMRADGLTQSPGRAVAGETRNRTVIRYALMTAQIAVTLVLVTTAALLLRSLWKMQSTPLGFTAESVLTVPLTLPRHAYNTAEHRARFYELLEQKTSAMPGVSAVALADSLPPSGAVQAMIYSLIEVEGRPKAPQGTGGMVPHRTVTPGFFKTLQIPIWHGRGFVEADREPGSDAVVLGDGLARRLFDAASPQAALGKRLRFGTAPEWHTVVGISAGINNSGFAPREPEYYQVRRRIRPGIANDQAREAGRRATLLVRTHLSPALASQWLSREIAALDPTLPFSIEPMSRRVDDLTARPRFQAMLLTLFAILAMTLAAAGLYGLVSLLVTQRTREIGIRLALGAAPAAATRLMVRQAMLWCGVGVGFGLIGSYTASKLVAALLYQTAPRDPVVWSVSCLVLLSAAWLAAWIPARRAARVDPAVTLRMDN